MANVTRDISFTKSAYAKQSSPNTNYATNTSTNYSVSTDDGNSSTYKFLALGGANTWPASLKRKKIIQAAIRVYARVGGSLGLSAQGCVDFTPSSVTYNNQPSSPSGAASGYVDASGLGISVGTWSDIWIPLYSSGSSYNARYAVSLLKNGGVILSAGYYNSQTGGSPWYVKTVLANGSTKAYVRITYNDAVNITSKPEFVSASIGGSPLVDKNVTWKLVKNSTDYCYDETFTQASAKFFWRVSGSSSWNQISVSGSTMSLTIPAGTFPAGKTIEYYLQTTDTDGTTASTSTSTATMSSPTLTATSYPSGSNLDIRNAYTFSWTLRISGTDYTQASAKLYWRKSGASSWNQISVSGNTKTLSVPGNTFPTGATVEWYLSATDIDGNTATTSSKTFTTASSAIAATVYPSGNAVESGTALTFSWNFSNSYGNYNQTSASLFWRSTTAEAYHEIQASGDTQSLTVPKNTFPGSSTISWYLTGVDVGGSASQTSVMTFKTVSSQITPQSSPTSGYVDPREAVTFQWYFATPKASYDQASATFHWRIQGDETWNDVSASGSTRSVTIPANTFPVASTVEWYVEGTDAGGNYSTSEVYNFSTAASTAYAVCVSPVGKVVEGIQPITLTWIVQNSDGSAAARTIVQWKLPSESQSSWHTLLNTTEEVLEYTIAAGFFAAGPVEWRVQAVNRDGAAGPANAASFVVLRSPAVPQAFAASSVPRTTISWQSSEQEAYEITLDGKIISAEYGPGTYKYQVEEPLADGVHHIRLRVQGMYGLWSDYVETSISVENVPAASLSLTGEFGVDADLLSTGQPDDDGGTELHWYRDGKRIARTIGEDSFKDRFALGTHVYHVEYWQADGNYTRSNPVTGTMTTESVLIAPVSGGEWIQLKLSSRSSRNESFSWSRNAEFLTLSAATYPALELSEHENMVGSYECSFSDVENALAFERLRGRIVVIKSRRGNVLVGGLLSLNKQVTEFYADYAFTVQQINWEDFVDGTDN